MEMSDVITEAYQRLAVARRPEAERLVQAMSTSRILGVLGEAEVGKTETIKQALRLRWQEARSRPQALLTLDLGRAANGEHLASMVTKQISSAVLGINSFTLVSTGTLLPAPAEGELVKLSRLIGVDGVDEALRPWPSGTFPLEKALVAIEDLAADHKTTVWIDHAEAPSLTPRHPLDVDGLLWGIRAMAQRSENLSLIIAARDAFERELQGRDRAFYEQGRWLELDNPPSPIWEQIGEQLGVKASMTEELVEHTRGHPPTMLRALPLAATGGGLPLAAETIRELTIASGPLTSRAIQHARSLHRLGGQVLEQIALGQRPYAAAQKGASPPQEIRKVLGRLHLAGLIRHDPDGWSVVDPLVEAALSHPVQLAIAEEWPATGR